jgi:hypothetical protein
MAWRAIDRGVPTQDLLQSLGVRNEPLAVHDQPLELALGIDFARIVGSYEVHGHVRIDKYHGLQSPA